MAESLPASSPGTDPEPRSATELLLIVYDELRRLARQNMAREDPGHALTPTMLVHEAFLRIVGDRADGWASRAQFFSAAAEAMRRILIEDARARGRLRNGGQRRRITLSGIDLSKPDDLDQVPDIDEALQRLAQADPQGAQIVHLRFYAGLSEEATASVLGVSARTIRREWAYARAWLFEALKATE